MPQPETNPAAIADPLAKRSSSPRKLASARANGVKSRGATTPAGKAICAATSKNLRHGMLAQTLVPATESRERFDALVQSYIDEFRPATPTEHAMVETLATARWRQLRAILFQKIDLDLEISKQPQIGASPAVTATLAWRALHQRHNSLMTAVRAEAVFERQYNRALRTLELLAALNPEAK